MLRLLINHHHRFPFKYQPIRSAQKHLMVDAVLSEPSSTDLKVLPHNQYESGDALSPSNVSPSPLDQFRDWFKQAVDDPQVHEPEVMSLSTATLDGIPSARMVLFKQIDARGFMFFTNYTSRKSRELESNPNAALVFYWAAMHRSVRVLGKVEKVSKQDSEEYYNSRPVGSRLGAWASDQSNVVKDGEVQERLHAVEERFGIQSDSKDLSVKIPLPEFWGGWRVVPTRVLFLIHRYHSLKRDYLQGN